MTDRTFRLRIPRDILGLGSYCGVKHPQTYSDSNGGLRPRETTDKKLLHFMTGSCIVNSQPSSVPSSDSR